MGERIGRIEARGGGASAGVVARLVAGESPGAVARSSGLDALDLIAAIASEGLGPEGSEGSGLVRAAPAHPRLAEALAESSMADWLPDSPRPGRLALAAGLLQILDHWDASHAAAQEADDLGERAASAYWHLIAHRREPDPGNALYWARRVGRHPTREAIARAARPLLEAHPDRALAGRLVGAAGWDHAAMIELATGARPGSTEAALARRLQRIEMIHLLDATATAAGLAGGQSRP